MFLVAPDGFEFQESEPLLAPSAFPWFSEPLPPPVAEVDHDVLTVLGGQEPKMLPKVMTPGGATLFLSA